MPNVPRINPQVSGPGVSSVGRQRINAPVEAFGGGRAASGLGQLGSGLKALGQGVEQVDANQQREQNQAAKAEAIRQAKLNKLSGDRKVLTYDQQMQEVSNALKSTNTSGDGSSPKKNELYSKESEKIREKILKDTTDPAQREALLLRMERSDLARMNSLASAQITEDKKFNADTRSAQGNSLVTQMGGSSDTLLKGGVREWFGQFGQSSTDYAAGLVVVDGVAPEKAKQLVEDKLKSGADTAIRNRMAGISQSIVPTGDADELKAIVDEMPSNMFDKDEKKELKKEIDTAAKTRIKDIENQRDTAIKNQMSNYSDKIANADDDIERQNIKNEFIRENPLLKKSADSIYNSSLKDTSFIKKSELEEDLALSKNLDTYKDDLLKQLNDGDIGLDAYKEFKKLADTEIPKKKAAVWKNGLRRFAKIKGGLLLEGDPLAEAGKGEIRRTGAFTSDIKIDKEFMAQWNGLKDLAFDPNVTERELLEIQDAVFFKPEASMQAKSAEDRMIWAEDAFRTAGLEPGTQDLDEADIDPDRKVERDSDEVLLQKAFPGIDLSGVKQEEDIRKSVADMIKSTFE